DFDLLPFDQSGQVSMDKSATNRINLALMKHDFACTDAFDINREDSISSRFGAQDSCQLCQWSHSSNGFGAAAVYRNGNHPVAPRSPRIIFAAAISLFSLDLKLFFLRHDF